MLRLVNEWTTVMTRGNQVEGQSEDLDCNNKMKVVTLSRINSTKLGV